MIDLLNSMESLQKIGEMEFIGSFAYKLSKALKQISNELETYNQARQKMLNQYGEKDQKGNLKIRENDSITILPDKIQTYNEEIQKLNNLDIELNIPYLDESDLDKLKLTPREMMNISWWIQEKTPE